jgi:hypothetical protein
MVRAYVPPVRLIALFVAMLAMVAATVVFAGPARAQTTPLTIPDVEGKVYNKKTGKLKGTFEGQIEDPVVSYKHSKKYKGLMVSGTLVGELTKKANPENPIPVNKEFKTKAKASVPGPAGSGEVTAQAVCNILTLNIGAIHLDLLGLVVDLSPIDLVIDAVSGPGNLLGNLLCAVAGLLDPSNPLANFLNALLEQLFGGLSP